MVYLRNRCRMGLQACNSGARQHSPDVLLRHPPDRLSDLGTSSTNVAEAPNLHEPRTGVKTGSRPLSSGGIEVLAHFSQLRWPRSPEGAIR